MAMRSLSAPEMRTLTDRMLADLARMETMVTRILDSVRLERGRVDLRPQPIELATVVARVVAQFEERARADRIAISADVPRDLEVLADPIAVDVVVRNLVENALAAVAPVGGGTVALTAQRTNGEVELSVRDSGVGFRPTDSGELFKKFSRLHPGGGSTYDGSGLGLYIVRRMMQLAGGRVSAHSDGVGRGALFVLAWPMAPAESA
jgi:signal transduction histidine kinase